jgi:FKBP-type peptidyl-prolyl cis-trans isomerase FkpA
MKRLFYLFIIISLIGCRDKYYRTETGLLFKIIGNSKDSIAKIATTAKIHYIQKAGDTIIESTYDKMPLYYMVMPGYGNRYNPLEVFDYGVREGDSIVTIQRVDSMMKKGILDKLPPYLKKDDEWYSYLKVVKVFRNDSLLQMDKFYEQKKVDSLQKILGPRRVENYLKDHDIKYLKSDSGVYVQIINPGQGAKIDTGTTVMLKYNFKLMNGRVFDSNIDTSFHRPDTLQFVVGRGYMMKAVDEGLKFLKPGAHANFYLPTMSAFGGATPMQKLRAYDDVILEVKLLGVK